ncbi:MAG: nucleotide exchange factor GrpE [Nanohaloarchaea archaeon]|nr:nucleotide exchange factor GrpE [Candidatus Nanohaloarchaea archaeon]
MMEYENLSREELGEALETFEKEVDELEQEKNKWEEKAKKVKADFENYKKKQDERKEKWQHRAREDLAEDLIQIMDNLERAIASADEDSTVLQGVKMVADQLLSELEKRGLERIDAEGEEFDPRLHKAVDTEEHEEENKVLKQKRKGYMFGDKVLREAEVVVSKRAEEQN